MKPILTITDGEVIPVGRAHGSRKALAELAAEFERRTAEGSAPQVGIAHADAPERMAALRELVLRARPRGADRGRDDAGRRRRHACRARHGRALLVRGGR